MKKIKKIDTFEIPSYSLVKLVSCGDIKKVVFVGIESDNLRNFKKISGDEMVDLRTGEIIKCNVSDTREDNIISLKKTISRLRDLINCNFFGADNELFITLTYKDNMRDYRRLYDDFKKFYQKLKRRFKGVEFCYISVIEPQERGAWHVHLLLKALNKDSLFIDNDSVVSKLWGHGFTKTKRLRGVDNVGAYLSSYLTDVFSEKGKKKGARLYLYPAGVNIYRCSRNCKRPVEGKVVYNKLSGMSNFKTYEVSFGVYDENESCLNVIKKEFYNLRRKK